MKSEMGKIRDEGFLYDGVRCTDPGARDNGAGVGAGAGAGAAVVGV